jgi:hypothetical protein
MTVAEIVNSLERLMSALDADPVGRNLGRGDFLTDSTPSWGVLEDEAREALFNVREGGLEDVFITSDGKPNYQKHLELERVSDKKFRIVCGERDSFGWLSSVLLTPRGQIVFG